MKLIGVFVFGACVLWCSLRSDATHASYVNGCRSQSECAENRCCVFDWIPGTVTEIGLCVEPSPEGGICTLNCPNDSCEPRLDCLPDVSDPGGRIHICQKSSRKS